VATDPQATDRPGFRRIAVFVALVLGVLGLIVSSAGLAIAIMPRHFTAGQRQAILAWEVGGRWRNLAAGQIFPSSVGYTLPDTVIADNPALVLHAVRVAIAPQTGCASGVSSSAAAAVLRREGCEAMLRATYVDQTMSFVMTVGVAVLPSANAASAASAGLSVSALAVGGDASTASVGAGSASSGSGSGGSGSGGSASDGSGSGGSGADSAVSVSAVPAGVRVVHFGGTVGSMYDYSRQLAATLTAGPYLVLYAAGYADGRPRVQLAHDSYSQAEITSLAQGVASTIATSLGAAPPLPRCPGSPGC
jgi:uncharacterized membrane protein YgcG